MIYLLGQKSGNVSLDTTGKKKKTGYHDYLAIPHEN